MEIGIIGAGRIGGGLARQLVGAGHRVMLSFSRDRSNLEKLAAANQFGAPPLPAEGQTAAAFNAARMPGARYTKSFNTLTSGFQSEAALRTGGKRVVQWLCGDDSAAKVVVARLIEDAGFVPVDLGGTAGCAVMEAPRRPGAVYGEEYRAADTAAVVAAVRVGDPIPPTPRYG